MKRLDVGLSVAAALLFLFYVAVTPTGISTPIGRYIVDPGLHYWYVGAAAIAVSLVLRWRGLWPRLARLFGFIGVAWVTFWVSYYGLLFLLIILSGPMGY
jgi:hypothetical protein